MDEGVKFLNSGIFAPIKKWGTKWSLWPVHLVTACCGVELAHAYACGYDGERIGSLNYGITRQTNLIIVEGAITRKMARVLKIAWEQMPEPKFVMVMGACGLKGGLFWNGYHMVKPSDVVPVDFFIPGCPPTPEALLREIRSLQDKIMKGSATNTAKFENVDLGSILKVEDTELIATERSVDLRDEGAKVGEPKATRLPEPPHIIAPTPLIKIDVPKEVEWAEGMKIVEDLKKKLEGESVEFTITDKDRICLKTMVPEKMPEIADKIKDTFDHAKSVNVIDVPHEDKFIVEYVLGCYSKKELMAVLLTLATEIPRDDPKLPSLVDIWPSADYMEREMYDLFGVWFEGNAFMGINFLLAPDTQKFPLRKDFEIQKENYVVEGKEVV
ncbi:MAG: NADH-quinone oxidoreductase subunit NuoB [Methanosarcinales archaeon]